MREQVFVRTQNVVAAEAAITKLLHRPIHELVGLGLFYGDRGLGKTKLIFNLACKKGFLYFRIDASETAKSFAKKLLNGLRYRLNITDMPVDYHCNDGEHVIGSTNEIMNKCIRLMQEVSVVIFIDEFDNALPNRELRESIRDIVDKTFSAVILVGMQSIREKLEYRHPHFFDRCNAFVEFKSLSRQDAGEICKAVAEVPFSDRIVDAVYSECAGNYRKLIKGIILMENKVKGSQNPELSADDRLKISETE